MLVPCPVVNTHYLTIAVQIIAIAALYTVAILNVRLEQISYLSNVVALEFLAIETAVMLKIKVEEILGSVVLIHAYVFELKLYFDVVIGEIGWKLDQLVSKVFNKLIVDIRYPGLQLDRHILKHKMNFFLFFQDRLYFNHMLIL